MNCDLPTIPSPLTLHTLAQLARIFSAFLLFYPSSSLSFLLGQLPGAYQPSNKYSKPLHVCPLHFPSSHTHKRHIPQITQIRTLPYHHPIGSLLGVVSISDSVNFDIQLLPIIIIIIIMSTTEEQELRDKISRLTSVLLNTQRPRISTNITHISVDRINRHKEQSNGTNHGIFYPATQVVYSKAPVSLRKNLVQDYPFSGRGVYHRPAPYPQHAHRGGRGRFQPTYRNRTLVLNGGAPSTASNQENHAPDPTTPSWVTRTDRHLQLINRDVYERETQQRSQAIEQTLQQRRLDKARREKAQFLKNMQQVGGDVMAASSNSSKPASRYEVDVEGVRFHVTQQGSKLVKAPGAFPRCLW